LLIVVNWCLHIFTLIFSIIFYTFSIQLLKFIEGLLSLFCFEWASDCCIMSNISAISWQEQVTITMRMMSILYKTKTQSWIFSITQQSTVQQYFSYILAVRFIGGRHHSTATPRKSLMNFNRCHIMYTTPWTCLQTNNFCCDRHLLNPWCKSNYCKMLIWYKTWPPVNNSVYFSVQKPSINSNDNLI
jgi:hypothetical protein